MKILMFSPHAFYKEHSIPEAIVGDSLIKDNHEIIVVNCNGIYKNYCLCMHSVHFTNTVQKNYICNQCRQTRNNINIEFNFKTILIDDYINDEDIKHVDNILSQVDQSNYIDFNFDNIPFAKYSLYEFWLKYKLSSINLSSSLWSEYLIQLKNSLITYFAINKILSRFKPDRITTYNTLYSVNRIVYAVAEHFNIPTFSLHAGSHIKRRVAEMVIVKGMTHEYNRDPFLKIARERSLNNKQIKIVTQHVRELFKSTSPWVYSVKNQKLSSNTLRSRLCIKNNQKVLLAVMRSNDERIAAKFSGVHIFDTIPLFNTQTDWLNWLIDFSKNNSNIFIIFRIHPREFPNKRENVLSENAVSFMNYISNLTLPSNFFINIPDDDLSVHDLLKITDVLLNNSSSVGLEASLYGIPIIGIGDNLYSFDPILQKEATTLDEYEFEIKNSITDGWDFNKFILAYRWLNYLFSDVAIDISDAYYVTKYFDNKILNLFYRIFRKLLNIFHLFWNKKSKILPNLIHKKGKLLNSNRVSYAIINDQKSDIGIFSTKDFGVNKQKEIKKLKKEYLKLMSSLASNDDVEFQSRVQNSLNKIPT